MYVPNLRIAYMTIVARLNRLYKEALSVFLLFTLLQKIAKQVQLSLHLFDSIELLLIRQQTFFFLVNLFSFCESHKLVSLSFLFSKVVKMSFSSKKTTKSISSKGADMAMICSETILLLVIPTERIMEAMEGPYSGWIMQKSQSTIVLGGRPLCGLVVLKKMNRCCFGNALGS